MRLAFSIAIALLVALPVFLPLPALAGLADVQKVEVRCRPAPGGRPASICTFTVTVKHADAGWDHYANRFEVVAPDGKLLITRILRHPHVDEQPFTRSQGRVRIMHTMKTVELRAGDLVDGLGGATVTVEIPHAASKQEQKPE